MKQEITIKVQMNCDKCRTKAMKLVASAGRVDSVALAGDSRDQLVVVGDGVDAVYLTCILRKKLKYADIVKLEEGKKKEEQKKKKEEEEKKKALEWYCYPNYPHPYPHVIHYDDYYCNSNPNNCSIM
ncbi:hypothetical protein Cni_G00710 [Canna indica]|uniref:HMA domain-containing protein n=1 Tax=Canna indica TaxID=4628 RepID=A0AAQ3Q002_9LILI|nr:hypothetical protein Cni_G00710 [Canna indica]